MKAFLVNLLLKFKGIFTSMCKPENRKKLLWILIIILIGAYCITTIKMQKALKKCINSTPQTEIITTTIHDTINFTDTVIYWKTYHKKDTIINLDTLFSQDTIIIYQLKESLPDTFYYRSRYKDSIIDVEIFLLGEGILDKTKIDSVVLNYEVHPQYIIKYKNCKRCKRLYYKFCRKCL